MNSSDISSLTETILSHTVPLATFILGFIAKIWYDSFTKHKEKDKIRQSLNLELDTLREQIVFNLRKIEEEILRNKKGFILRVLPDITTTDVYDTNYLLVSDQLKSDEMFCITFIYSLLKNLKIRLSKYPDCCPSLPKMYRLFGNTDADSFLKGLYSDFKILKFHIEKFKSESPKQCKSRMVGADLETEMAKNVSEEEISNIKNTQAEALK